MSAHITLSTFVQIHPYSYGMGIALSVAAQRESQPASWSGESLGYVSSVMMRLWYADILCADIWFKGVRELKPVQAVCVVGQNSIFEQFVGR